MRITTVSGAGNSAPALFPKPPRPSSASHVLFLRSDSKLNRISKLFLRNPRYSERWVLNAKTPESSNGRKIAAQEYLRPKNATDDHHKNLVTKLDKALNHFILPENSLSDFVKMTMMFGCLITLQGSQPAIASTDLSAGISSLPYFQDLGDITTGFASAFLLIFFSELGDKTFFIAALLAARNSAGVVFVGTFGALSAMSVISVALGRTFHYVDEILPFSFRGNDLPLDDITAVILLVYFGVSTLLDASSSDGLKGDEERKEAELAVSGLSGNGAGIVTAASTVVSTFLLVFVAEWGDKSFFSTIALAAASSPLGVIAGALAGHGVATLLAVLGGSLLGSFLSEKVIAYVGGVLFLVFAGITLVEIVN